jgi:integrase-like protein
LHLADAGVSICTRNCIMTGLRFLFRVTLRRLDLAAAIYHIREPQKIPLVMSTDETGCWRWLAASRRAFSAQKIIRIEQSKGRKDRNVMLSAGTLDLLRQWWKARRSRHDGQTPVQERWLFPGTRPGRPMTTRQLNRLFHEAADAAGIKKGRGDHRQDFGAQSRAALRVLNLRTPMRSVAQWTTKSFAEPRNDPSKQNQRPADRECNQCLADWRQRIAEQHQGLAMSELVGHETGDHLRSRLELAFLGVSLSPLIRLEFSPWARRCPQRTGAPRRQRTHRRASGNPGTIHL